MGLEELIGKYMRLRVDLSYAYGAAPWNSAHLDRISDEMASVERSILQTRPWDEQTSDTLAGLLTS